MGLTRHLRDWGWHLAGGFLLVLAVGCRLPPPNVRPPEPPQELNTPPDTVRYDNPDNWPKCVMDDPNPKNRSKDADLFKQGGQTTNVGGMQGATPASFNK